MDKYIIVFCEGEHDIAFLTRLLSINGYVPYSKKVSEFEVPLNELYITNLSKKIIEDSEFKFQRPKRKVPYCVLQKENTLVIFHNFDGDGNFLNGGANAIIKMYIGLNDENRRRIQKYEKLDYRFLYFLEADNDGVVNRLNMLKDSLELDELPHYTIMNTPDYDVGCYIFHDELDTDYNGKLEDVLLSLMRVSNESIFENSNNFILNNILDAERQRRFICNNVEEHSTGRIEFKKEKAIIAAAGQLQFSGSSNAVIIANSDYIKKNDMHQNTHCQNIIQLFN